MTMEENRYSELRQDIKDLETVVREAFSELRTELHTNYVGRGEYETAIFALRRDNTDLKDQLAAMKEQSRWNVSQVIVVVVALIAAGISLADIYVR